MSFKLITIYLMSLFYILSGIKHFTNVDWYMKIMPPYLLYHKELVYLSGAFEIILGIMLIFNMTTESYDWEWKFRDHGFQKRGGGRYSEDWTHVNDIDLIDERYVMVSIRNFDQIILIDLLSDEIVLTLGEDGQHKTMYEQHNPQYLLSSKNLPTILVADSENDRVVEYEYSNDTWEPTWKLSGNFSWPRDADRLPNGNTLITDCDSADIYEENLMRRLAGLLYIDNKTMGDIKEKIKKKLA